MLTPKNFNLKTVDPDTIRYGSYIGSTVKVTVQKDFYSFSTRVLNEKVSGRRRPSSLKIYYRDQMICQRKICQRKNSNFFPFFVKTEFELYIVSLFSSSIIEIISMSNPLDIKFVKFEEDILEGDVFQDKEGGVQYLLIRHDKIDKIEDGGTGESIYTIDYLNHVLEKACSDVEDTEDTEDVLSERKSCRNPINIEVNPLKIWWDRITSP